MELQVVHLRQLGCPQDLILGEMLSKINILKGLACFLLVSNI